MAAAEQKKSIVFVLENKDCNNKNDFIELYAFDKRLISIKEESKIIKKRNSEGYKFRLVEDLKDIGQAFTKIDHCHALAGYASCGHRIFKIGGDYRYCNKRKPSASGRPEPRPFSREAHYFDTRRLRDSPAWTNLPMMNAARKDPHLHVLMKDTNKKKRIIHNRFTLFAIGGFGSYKEYQQVKHYFPFMERLQLDLHDDGQLVTVKGWSPVQIPMPPETVDVRRFVSANIKNTITLATGRSVGPGLLIGFCGSRSFHLFTPADNTWEFLPQLQFDLKLLDPCTGWHSAPAMVFGTRLFWFDYRNNKLVGLDIGTGEYVLILLKDEDLLPYKEYRYELLHPRIVALDDDDDNNEVGMALIWRDYYCYAYQREDAEEETDLSDINGYHCTKFTVNFDRALQGDPCIRILSSQMCLAPSNNSGILHYLSTVLTADFGVDEPYNHLNGKIEPNNQLNGKTETVSGTGRKRRRRRKGKKSTFSLHLDSIILLLNCIIVILCLSSFNIYYGVI